MKTKIISILTQKGGVGKTTTSIHLGACFSEIGKKVLIVDFDGQRNVSIGFKIPDNYSYTVKNLLENTGDFRMVRRADNLFVLAGDKELEEVNLSENTFKNALHFIGEKFGFDFIIVDCPPSPITKNLSVGKVALIASDYVISPINTDEYSVSGIMELLPKIIKVKNDFNPNLQFLGFFFNKVMTNTKNFREYKDMAEERAGDFFFKSFVRQDINVDNAMKLGKTIFQVSPQSRASLDLKELAKEIINKI